MKRKLVWTLVAMIAICSSARAQWTVIDPSNLAQGIINSTKNVVHTSSTAQTMLKSFAETQKIYEQGKKYYDALRAVNNLVRDARRVQQTILLVGDISDMYVSNFNKMLADKNFSVDELSAIAFGYTKILQQSSDLLIDLKQVTTETGLSMTDKERMEIVDQVYNQMLNRRNLADYYTRKVISVSYLRSRESGDLARIRALYGSQSDKYW